MDYNRFYSHFGCSLVEVSSDNAKSDCPFEDCQKEEHFFVNTETGQFQCKKCGRSGNVYSFMTQYHIHALDRTTDKDYKQLAKARGILAESIQLAKWARLESGIWLVPYFGDPGKNLVNLGNFNPDNRNEKSRYRIHKVPEIPLALYRLQEKVRPGKSVIICEGEWDALALYSSYRSCKKAPGEDIWSVPGASWNKKYNSKFKGHSVLFIPDNDQGGETLKSSIAKHAKGFSYSYANWNYAYEALGNDFEGKDPRDVFKFCKPKADALPIFLDMFANAIEASETTEEAMLNSEYSVDIDEIPTISSRKEFRSRIVNTMYTNESMLTCIDLIMASCLNLLYGGEPFWVFVFGPPSSGKTKTIEAFGGNNKYFDYASKLTAKALVSGKMKHEGDDEPSNLVKYNNKVLFIKDMTVVLGMSKDEQQALWDILRDIYDGYVKVPFGNGKIIHLTDIKMGCVAGVTDAIHARNDSDMGERFLKIDWLGSDPDEFSEMDHMTAGWNGVVNRTNSKKELQETLLGYYKHLHENFSMDKMLEVPDDIDLKLRSLARLVVRVTAKVSKDRFEGIKYKPRPAVATRFYILFKKVIQLIAYIRQDEAIGQGAYDAVSKLALDTCNAFNLQVIKYIYDNPKATRHDMINELGIPSTRMHAILTDFESLKLVKRVKKTVREESKSGRPTYTYELDDTVKDCLIGIYYKKARKPNASNSTKNRKRSEVSNTSSGNSTKGLSKRSKDRTKDTGKVSKGSTKRDKARTTTKTKLTRSR